MPLRILRLNVTPAENAAIDAYNAATGKAAIEQAKADREKAIAAAIESGDKDAVAALTSSPVVTPRGAGTLPVEVWAKEQVAALVAPFVKEPTAPLDIAAELESKGDLAGALAVLKAESKKGAGK